MCVLAEIVVVGENSEAVDTRNAHAHAYFCRTRTHTNAETQDSGTYIVVVDKRSKTESRIE